MLAYLVLFLLLGSFVQYFMLRSENRKRQSGQREHLVEGLDAQQVYQRGDMRPDFIYTL